MFCITVLLLLLVLDFLSTNFAFIPSSSSLSFRTLGHHLLSKKDVDNAAYPASFRPLKQKSSGTTTTNGARNKKGDGTRHVSERNTSSIASLELLKSTYGDSSIESHIHDLVYYLSDLGERGVTGSELMYSGMWTSIENKLISVPLTPNECSDPSFFSLAMDILTKISGLRINWDRLSRGAQEKIDRIVNVLLTTSFQRYNDRLPRIVTALLGIRMLYKDLSPETRSVVKSQFISYLTNPSEEISISTFLTSMTRLGLSVSDFTDIEFKKLKQSLTQLIPTLRRSSYSRLLQGLADMDFKWSRTDLALRQELEATLRAYKHVSDWQHSPKEIASVLSSLSRMAVRWADLSVPSRAGLLTSLSNAAQKMTPRDLSTSLRSLGGLGVHWDDLKSVEGLQDTLLLVFKKLSQSMTVWDLAYCTLGLGQLEAPSEGLLKDLANSIPSKLAFFGPALTSQFVLGIGLMNADGFDAGSDQLKLFSELEVLSKQWVPRMTSVNIADTLFGLSLISSKYGHRAHGTEISRLWEGYVTPNNGDHLAVVASDLFRKKHVETMNGVIRDDRSAGNSEEVTEMAIAVNEFGDGGVGLPADGDEIVMRSFQTEGLDVSRFLLTMGRHGLTYTSICKEADVLEAIQKKIILELSSYKYANAGLSWDKDIHVPVVDILRGLVGVQARWYQLSADVQRNILNSFMGLLKVYQDRRHGMGTLFPVSDDNGMSVLKGLVDECMRSLACMQLPWHSLNVEVQSSFITLCRTRIEDELDPRTIATVVLFLGGMRWEWGSSKSDYYDFTSMLSASLVEAIPNMTSDERTAVFLGLHDCGVRWDFLDIELQQALLDAMHEQVSWDLEEIDAKVYGIEKLGRMGGLEWLSPRRGDRILVFLSRVAESLDTPQIMSILPVLHYTRTTNIRMLSYLSRRLVAIALSVIINQPSAFNDFISLLQILNDMQNRSSSRILDDAAEKLSRQHIERELRQDIVYYAGVIFRSLQAQEILRLLNLLAALGIRWTEFSVDRHTACLLTLQDALPFLTAQDQRILRESLLEMGVSESKLSFLAEPSERVRAIGGSSETIVAMKELDSDDQNPRVISKSQEESLPVKTIPQPQSNGLSNKKLPVGAGDRCTLEDVRAVFATTKNQNVANTLWFCASSGHNIVQLQGVGLWGMFDERICKTVSEWAHDHRKLSMLFNALEKLKVGPMQLSPYTREQITSSISAQFPLMSPRAVSNILYYMARLRWRPMAYETPGANKVSFCEAGLQAFLRTCEGMSEANGEFSNALWAAGHVLGLRWSSMPVEDQTKIAKAIEARDTTLSARDISAVVEALKVMRIKWRQLPLTTAKSLEQRIAETVFHMDAVGVSSTIGNLGCMGTAWNYLSPVTRVSLREAIVLTASKMSARGLQKLITGLGQMRALWTAFSATQQDAICNSIESALLKGSLDAKQYKDMLEGFILMKTTWNDFRPSTKQAIENAWSVRVSDDVVASMDFLVKYNRMGMSWDELRPKNITKFAIFATDKYFEANKNISSEVFGIVIDSFIRLDLSVKEDPIIPKSLSKNIISQSIALYETNGMGLVQSLWNMRELGVVWSDLPSASIKKLIKAIDRLTKTTDSDGLNVRTLNELIETCTVMGALCTDFPVYLQSKIESCYETARSDRELVKYSGGLHNFVRCMRDNNIAVAKTAESVQKLKRKSPSDADNLIMQQSSSAPHAISQDPRTSDRPVNTISDLNRTLPRMSNTDILRVVFLLGKHRVPGSTLLAGGAVSVLDDRLHGLLSELSPAAIIAVLTSLGRMNLKIGHFPRSAPVLTALVAASAPALDSRTLKTALKSMICLGVTWDHISDDQRMGLVAGIARSASTSPTAFGTLLSVLHDLGVPYTFLHDKIHIVLRHALFTVCSDILISLQDKSLSQEALTLKTENFMEIVIQLDKLGATWDQLGDKAGLTILKALSHTSEALLNGSSSTSTLELKNLFIDIPSDIAGRLERSEKIKLSQLLRRDIFREQ